jgi:hypothetical protein
MNRRPDGYEGQRPGREELAAPESSGRLGPLDHPSGDEHLRATQPLPPRRRAEAGEAVGAFESSREDLRREQMPARSSAGGDFLADSDRESLRQRWLQMQAGFVDSPEQTVEEADRLIGDVLERVTRSLTSERQELAARWSGSERPDTEGLRLAIQGYRALFERLLGT